VPPPGPSVPPPTPPISVVLPVYRNRRQLPELVRRLASVLAARGAEWEIVFVDDCGEDGAREWIAERAAEDRRLRLVVNPRNLGQHRAIVEGLRAARGALTVVMDADLQDAPEDVPRLLDAWRPGIGAVFAVRRRPYQSRIRHLTGRLFKRFVRALAGGRIPPRTGTFLAMERALREEIAATREERPYLPLLVAQTGRPLATVEIERAERADGESAYTLRRRVVLGLEAASRALRWRVRNGARAGRDNTP
jgi:polyisoprenyl-phosphate glycosyltransferase